MNQIHKEAPVRSGASIDQPPRSIRSHVRTVLLSLVGAVALLALAGAAPAMAQGGFGITSFSNALTNADGTPATQAGSHPYEMTTTLNFPTFASGPNQGLPTENVKDVVVNLPPGLIGNPNAVPTVRRGRPRHRTLLAGLASRNARPVHERRRQPDPGVAVQHGAAGR